MLADQEWFAQLSGDRNPMHLDPLFARRTQAGAPVVHGMHGVLWALDLFAASVVDLPREIAVRFESFLYLDLDVEAHMRRQDEHISILLESRGRRITTISLLSPNPNTLSNPPAATARPIPGQPIDQDYSEATRGGEPFSCRAKTQRMARLSLTWPPGWARRVSGR